MGKHSTLKALALAFLAFVPTGGRAEDPWEAGWRVGVNSTNLQLSVFDTNASETRTTGTGELFVQRHTKGPLFVETGLGYVRRIGQIDGVATIGIGQDGTPIQVPVQSLVTLRTLQVPILLGFEVPAGRFSLHATAGLEFGILLSSDVETEIPGPASFPPQDVRHGLDDFFRDASLAFQVGAGAKLDLGPQLRVLLDLRYTAGLTHLTRDSVGSTLGRPEDFKVLIGFGSRL